MEVRVSRGLRVFWWMSVLWLALAFLGMSGNLRLWLAMAADSRRYETLIESALLLLISTPAVLGVAIVAVVPGTGFSRFKRVTGAVLALACIVVYLVHNHLEKQHRIFPPF